MSNLINFDKKNQPGFYDGIYSSKEMKKGFGNQLKDYIEGRITADQLFKKRATMDPKAFQKKSFDNENMTKNNINNNISEEDSKFNFIDLFKESLKGKGFPENRLKSNFAKEIIHEEDENFTKNNEANFLLNKSIKDKNIFQNRSNSNKKEEMNEEKKLENSSSKKEKEIMIKPKTEEEKIKIISVNKDKDKDKENEKQSTEPKNFEKKSSMKNAISNLFSVKAIIDNIKKEPNDSQTNDINKKENQKRPMTVHTNKKTNIEINPLKQNNSNLVSTIKEENENKKPKTGYISSVEIKKENLEKKMKENTYNSTLNSLGQNITPITNNAINKKSNSSNKKNIKYYVKQNKDSGNKGNPRAFSGIKKDDAKTFENIFNNLQSYIPKNDLNMNENNNFPLSKKK